MKTTLLLLLLVPTLFARDITTLDGETYRDCRVSRIYPDSICVLFSGSGARIKFTDLPETIREEFGYDPQRAAAFENSEAARVKQERALLDGQLQRKQAKRPAAANPGQPPGSQNTPPGGNPGGEYVAVNAAGAAPSGYNQAAPNQLGGYRGTGAQFVAVRMAWPGGGVYGLAYGPTRTRP